MPRARPKSARLLPSAFRRILRARSEIRSSPLPSTRPKSLSAAILANRVPLFFDRFIFEVNQPWKIGRGSRVLCVRNTYLHPGNPHAAPEARDYVPDHNLMIAGFDGSRRFTIHGYGGAAIPDDISRLTTLWLPNAYLGLENALDMVASHGTNLKSSLSALITVIDERDSSLGKSLYGQFLAEELRRILGPDGARSVDNVRRDLDAFLDRHGRKKKPSDAAAFVPHPEDPHFPPIPLVPEAPVEPSRPSAG